MTQRFGAAATSPRRDVVWVLVALAVVGALAIAGVLMRSAERDARQAALRSLDERVATSAALTDSVFKAWGALSRDQLTQRYGGADLADALRVNVRLRQKAGVSAPTFTAVTDRTGRVLAGIGRAPGRVALAAGTDDRARMSGVMPAGWRSAIQFVIPFKAADGSRRALVQGVPVLAVQAFLSTFLAGLPNPDGARLTMSDGAGVILARRQDRPDSDGPAAMVTVSSRVPGTPWRLTLAAPRSRVLAGVSSHRWVSWILLAALSVTGLAGVALLRRLERDARRVQDTGVELAASRDELQSLISALDEGVAHRDVNGGIHLLNDSARVHLDTDLTHIVSGTPPWRLLDEDGEPLEAAAYPGRQASDGRAVSGMVVGVDGADGTRRWLRFSARPLMGDGAPAPHPAVMSFTDVSAQRELQLHLTALAERDPLTGLMNRRRFEEELQAQLTRCQHPDEHGALVLLDIDQFKAINDSLGHLAGDEVLRTIARTLRGHLRAGDVAGRLGGDEFVILLVDADEEQARTVADDVVHRVRAALRSSMEGFDVTMTFGVAELQAGCGSAEAVLDASDCDMYRNKPAQPATLRSVRLPAPVLGEDRGRPQALSALYAAVRACDAYTAAHSRDVVAMARAVAVRLDLDASARSEVEHVALVHDIGKIAIPDAILHKPGRLTADEQALMRQHPVIGAQIVGSVEVLQHLAPAVRAEHERWDGSGYPDGLAGEEIPAASRIVFVCDAFDAMTTDRPYRSAMPEDDAVAELARHAGGQFCPSATAALLDVLAARRAGTFVRQ